MQSFIVDQTHSYKVTFEQIAVTTNERNLHTYTVPPDQTPVIAEMCHCQNVSV